MVDYKSIIEAELKRLRRQWNIELDMETYNAAETTECQIQMLEWVLYQGENENGENL